MLSFAVVQVELLQPDTVIAVELLRPDTVTEFLLPGVYKMCEIIMKLSRDIFHCCAPVYVSQ